MSAKSGRKVYRNKMKNRKKYRKNTLFIILFILLLAVLVFVGYSIARPIYNYFSERKNNDVNNAEAWEPPVYENEEESAVTTVSEDESPGDESPENTSDSLDFSAYVIPPEALSASDTLKNALAEAKNNGYTSAVVILKDKGGAIYYNTGSEIAASGENAVKGSMPAGQISAMITAAGLKPIASVNLLEDNNRYGANRTGSYKFAGDNSTWLDNSVANGGKPWLSPFDSDTQSYVEYLADEITAAGFDTVIFDGIVFPDFRNSDLTYIGQAVQDANRYNALVNIANIAGDTARTRDANPIIQVSAIDIINNKAEVFKPDLLNGSIFSVYYSPQDFNGIVVIDNTETVLSDLSAYDKTILIFDEIRMKSGGNVEIIPYIDNGGMINQSDLNDTLTALISLGYESYIIK